MNGWMDEWMDGWMDTCRWVDGDRWIKRINKHCITLIYLQHDELTDETD